MLLCYTLAAAAWKWKEETRREKRNERNERLGTEGKGRVPPPWGWVRSRTAKWTVMRHMSEGSEKKCWYFPKEPCSACYNDANTHSSHFKPLHVHPLGSTLYFFLHPCITSTYFPVCAFQCFPLCFSSSLFPLSFPLLSPTFLSCSLPSHINLSLPTPFQFAAGALVIAV